MGQIPDTPPGGMSSNNFHEKNEFALYNNNDNFIYKGLSVEVLNSSKW